MSVKALVIGLVATACVGAAAAGGFLAVRMNNADTAVDRVGAPNAPAVSSAPASHSVTSPRPSPAAPSPRATPAPATRQAPPVSSLSNPDPPQRPKQAAPVPVDPPVAAAPIPAAPPPPPTPVEVQTAPPPDTTVDPPPVDPPSQKPRVEDVTLATDSVIGIALDDRISSETARVEDKVVAHVARDVTVDGRVVIPTKAQLEGVVTLVERGGRFKAASRIGVRFTTLVLADNSRTPIQTDAIYRTGEPPANQAASKIGATAVVGAILGAVIGGGKGAAIGSAAGAAGGTAMVAAGDANAVVIPAGTLLTVRLTSPVTITVQRTSDGDGGGR